MESNSNVASPNAVAGSRGLMPATPARHRGMLAALAIQVAGIALAIAIWQGLSLAMGSYVMPTPADVAGDITTNIFTSPYLESHGLAHGGGYLPQLLYTVRNVVIGVGLGTIAGIGLGVVSIRFSLVGAVANAIMAVFGSAPIFVAAPFFLIWFGIVPTAQVLMVGFYTGLLMYIFARRAAGNVGPSYIESALTLGGRPWSLIRWVYMPASIPELIGGFRIALAGAWGLEAIAELLGAERGAGFLIKFFASAYLIQGMLALVLMLGVAAVIFDRLTVLVGMRLTDWTESGRQLQL